MTIYETIRSWRVQYGLTQREWAVAAQVPWRNIQLWESGQGDPPISDCMRLAATLGLSLAQFVQQVDQQGRATKQRRKAVVHR